MERFRLIIIVAVAFWLTGCQSGQAQQSVMKPRAFARLLQEHDDVQLIDVRTPREVQQGKIEGARMINFLEDDFREKIGQLDKDKPVALYCRSGNRSSKAAAMMDDMGFEEVYDLQGGVISWRQSGYALKKP